MLNSETIATVTIDGVAYKFWESIAVERTVSEAVSYATLTTAEPGPLTSGFQGLKKQNLPELAYAYSSLGMLELTGGHYKAGESDLRQAMAFANTSLGEDHPETAGYATNLALALLVQDRGLTPFVHAARALPEGRGVARAHGASLACAVLARSGWRCWWRFVLSPRGWWS